MKNIQKSNSGIAENAMRLICFAGFNNLLRCAHQNLIILMLIFPMGMFFSCSEEELSPIEDPIGTGPFNTTASLEDYRSVRTFGTGELNEWENGSLPESWYYFFISDFGEPDNYIHTTTFSGGSGKLLFSNEAFSLDGFGENDLLKIKWKLKMKSIRLSGSYFPMITAGIKEGNHPVNYGNWTEIKEVDGDWLEFTEYFRITKPGNYQVYFACDTKSPIDQMTIRWKDISCEQVRKQETTP